VAGQTWRLGAGALVALHFGAAEQQGWSEVAHLHFYD
jgi:hypothetical protein